MTPSRRFSCSTSLDLDRDGDGALDDADYAAILRGETEWQDGYVGDVYFEVNDTVKTASCAG